MAFFVLFFGSFLLEQIGKWNTDKIICIICMYLNFGRLPVASASRLLPVECG